MGTKKNKVLKSAAVASVNEFYSLQDVRKELKTTMTVLIRVLHAEGVMNNVGRRIYAKYLRMGVQFCGPTPTINKNYYGDIVLTKVGYEMLLNIFRRHMNSN